jgi:hypothetical protein
MIYVKKKYEQEDERINDGETKTPQVFDHLKSVLQYGFMFV